MAMDPPEGVVPCFVGEALPRAEGAEGGLDRGGREVPRETGRCGNWRSSRWGGFSDNNEIYIIYDMRT